jgi:hypothetical protein
MYDEIIVEWSHDETPRKKCEWYYEKFEDDETYLRITVTFYQEEQEYVLYIEEDGFSAAYETSQDYKHIYQIISAVTFDEVEPPLEEEFQEYCKTKKDTHE